MSDSFIAEDLADKFDEVMNFFTPTKSASKGEQTDYRT